MKKISITPLLLLCAASFGHYSVAASAGSPQSNLRLETIVRNDTLTRTDTVITTKKIKRTEVIQRVEEVYYSDSVAVANGVAGAPTVIMSGTPTYTATPVPVINGGVAAASAPAQIVPMGTGAVPANAPVATNPMAVVPSVESSAELLTRAAQAEGRRGGQYLWVPDSLRSDVEQVVAAGGIPVVEAAPVVSVVEYVPGSEVEMPFNPNEKVTFRGDTVNMVLRDRNWGRFDRGLFNYLFIPKGIWSIGVTASYGEFSTEDLEVLDLMSDIDFSGHIFSIRPYFSYFIGNNRSVGMRLGYSSGKANIGNFKVDIDEDMNFNLHDISYRSESYTAAITYNQYFGITRRGRFGIFNEVELAFSSGNSDFIRPFNGKLKTTHTNTMQAALNFSPGVSVYIMDPVTFNISFGVFGVNLRNEKQTVDGEDMGSRFTSGANFRFNIFNISFGVAVNL